ncbi:MULTISPECIES: DUF2277 domain-containing protein [unclassified Lysobacter]|nr:MULTISPECIES: DUF2277 domain-containing protein [unclassified Lysobacter]KQZ60126.1 hypothetical protein ASD53_02925 [Lysobacter sp. Root559]KRA77001.1 hypothetical protein ASD78_05155 [Lysobacter sp. Root667]KRC38569.1 hypothetical protein ASE10_03250 [Lysobacter sp. Root76]KRD71234.1 hypothetical protein ASE45_05230 [Lysobacter sp. Root96]
MCRNIRTLYNFEPPATGDEIRASALQFVRKLSGFNAPSKANEAAFNLAVKQVSDAATMLINSLTTFTPPKNRELERVKAAELSAKRFGKPGPAPKPKAKASRAPVR